jgi:ATP-binding cassette subfamily F protein 3
MTVLQVGNVRHGFGADELFRDVTLSLALGERAALVAPNGAGKSTLLRLIAGEAQPEAGSVVVRKGAKVAYYRQSHEVAATGTVLEAFLSGFGEVLELRHRLGEAQHAAASGTTEALDALGHAQEAYQRVDGDALEREVSMLAGSLGFSPRDLERDVASLSGGERGRLQLGIVLAQRADLLLLDEPTNHLDLPTIGWLEKHLASQRAALLVVSHDRAFLDAVTTQTFELGSRGLRAYPVSYGEYVELREVELERERGVVERQQAFIEKTEDFIRKNIAGQKTKQAQSRRKMLDKIDRAENPEDVWAEAERVRFRFVDAPRSGDLVLEASNLSAERGGRMLFRDVSLLVRRGERIGIVGPNGAGKSTLVKLLTEGPRGADSGTVKLGSNLLTGIFDQHLGGVNVSRTAVDEIRSVRGDFTIEKAREYLARFRFWGDDPLRVVSGFSGGERTRLALAKLLLEPKNLLFLDEPTNHLDIPAAEILEEALSGFEGTVFLVSHDRRFLESVATRIVEVEDGRVSFFPAGFADYWSSKNAKKTEEREAPSRDDRRRATQAPPAPAKAVSAPASDAQGRERFEKQREAQRALDKKKRRFADLEKLIADGEAKLVPLREKLKADPNGDWSALSKLVTEERNLTEQVDGYVDEWMRLGVELASE